MEADKKQTAEQGDKFYLICIFVTIVQNLFQFIPSNSSERKNLAPSSVPGWLMF